MLDTTTTTITAEPTTSLVVATTPMVAMNTLSEAINAAHDAVKGAGKTMLLKAKEAGELLLQAKSECAHGQFKPWIEENCAFSYDTANDYMKVAKNGACSTFDPSMSIRAFLDATSTPRKPAHADEEDGPSPMRTPATEAPKPSTTKELKAEIGRLAGELQVARDALATAEAHIKTLQEASGGPAITKEELEALRKENGELNEMFDEAAAEGKALRKEVEDLKRQLRKLTPPAEVPAGYNPAADF